MNGIDRKIMRVEKLHSNMSEEKEEERSDQERARASLLSGGERVAKGRQRDDDNN
jgi:hypothetical protein